MERVLAEYNKLLVADYATLALDLMKELEIPQVLFKWYTPKTHAALIREIEALASSERVLLWFSFLWHGGLFELADKERDGALTELRMPRKFKRLFSKLALICNESEGNNRRQAAVLSLGEKKQVDFLPFELFLKLRVPEFVSLWHGLFQRPKAPAVPHDWLMRQPVPKRGRLVEAAKICWYLDLWDGKSCLDEFPRIQAILHDPVD